MADIMLGVVSEVMDTDKYPLGRFVIKFTIKGLIEDCIAFPIDTFDEPEVGDPVVLYGLESILGYSYMWQKQRRFDYTRLRHKDSIINIKEDEITIDSGPGKSTITIKKDGDIEIKSSKSVKIDSSDITIKGSSSVKIDSSDVTITGGKLTVNGSAAPNGSGVFCGIPVCPFSGAPHVGNMASGT